MNFFAANSAGGTERKLRSLSKLLFTYGFDGTLDYFCKISAFSLD